MKIVNRSMPLAAIVMAGALIMPQPAAAQNNPKLTDPEIASVAVVANQVDIGYAGIAKQRSGDAEVLKFAETMARDHKAVIDQASALVTRLGVTPKDNSVSRQLLSGAAKTEKMLRAKKGASFNRAYIDNEVAYHKAVISTVENLLIPQSQNGELKALLQNVLPTLKAHLEHAEMLQQQKDKK